MGKGFFIYLSSFFFMANALAQDAQNEYRFDASVVHPLAKNLVSINGAGLVSSSDKHQNEYYISFPGFIYNPKKWLQFWIGFKDFFTNNWEAENTNEMRPYGGVKLLVPNSAKVHLFNFTQYEYRYIKKTNSKSVQEYGQDPESFWIGSTIE